jgi:hypothetical protein
MPWLEEAIVLGDDVVEDGGIVEGMARLAWLGMAWLGNGGMVGDGMV